jgi:hypothetical protein
MAAVGELKIVFDGSKKVHEEHPSSARGCDFLIGILLTSHAKSGLLEGF